MHGIEQDHGIAAFLGNPLCPFQGKTCKLYAFGICAVKGSGKHERIRQKRFKLHAFLRPLSEQDENDLCLLCKALRRFPQKCSFARSRRSDEQRPLPLPQGREHLRSPNQAVFRLRKRIFLHRKRRGELLEIVPRIGKKSAIDELRLCKNGRFPRSFHHISDNMIPLTQGITFSFFLCQNWDLYDIFSVFRIYPPASVRHALYIAAVKLIAVSVHGLGLDNVVKLDPFRFGDIIVVRSVRTAFLDEFAHFRNTLRGSRACLYPRPAAADLFRFRQCGGGNDDAEDQIVLSRSGRSIYPKFPRQGAKIVNCFIIQIIVNGSKCFQDLFLFHQNFLAGIRIFPCRSMGISHPTRSASPPERLISLSAVSISSVQS